MEPLICTAIHSKKIIRIYYNGGFRKLEPFCYGVSTSGDEVLRAYQTSGHSNSGNPAGWKLFRVSEISNLKITGEYFEDIRPGYNPKDPIIKRIYCCV
jgi:hypothetical protein